MKFEEDLDVEIYITVLIFINRILNHLMLM